MWILGKIRPGRHWVSTAFNPQQYTNFGEVEYKDQNFGKNQLFFAHQLKVENSLSSLSSHTVICIHKIPYPFWCVQICPILRLSPFGTGCPLQFLELRVDLISIAFCLFLLWLWVYATNKWLYFVRIWSKWGFIAIWGHLFWVNC